MDATFISKYTITGYLFKYLFLTNPLLRFQIKECQWDDYSLKNIVKIPLLFIIFKNTHKHYVQWTRPRLKKRPFPVLLHFKSFATPGFIFNGHFSTLERPINYAAEVWAQLLPYTVPPTVGVGSAPNPQTTKVPVGPGGRWKNICIF